MDPVKSRGSLQGTLNPALLLNCNSSEDMINVMCCFCPWLRGRRGFTRQPENSKRAHFRAPALLKPPKFHEKTPKREKTEEISCGREKEREILGPTVRATTPSGPHPFGSHNPTRPPPHQKIFWPNAVKQNWLYSAK